MNAPQMPPVPYQFTASQEIYHLAVRLYIDSLVGRALASAQAPRDALVSVLHDDAKALAAARRKEETEKDPL